MEEEGPSDGDEQIGGRAGNWESEALNWEFGVGDHPLARGRTHTSRRCTLGQSSSFSRPTESGEHLPGKGKRGG